MPMFYIDFGHTTIQGEDRLPDWPDPLRGTEFISDVAKFSMATVAAFLPVLVILSVFGMGGPSLPEDIPDFQMKHSMRPQPVDSVDPSIGPAAPAPPAPPRTPSVPATLLATFVALA